MLWVSPLFLPRSSLTPPLLSPLLSLKDTVLVTGAASGIGKLIATHFSALGSTVVLWDVNEKAVKEGAISFYFHV